MRIQTFWLACLFLVIIAAGCGKSSEGTVSDVSSGSIIGGGLGNVGNGSISTPLPAGMLECPSGYLQSVFDLINGVRAKGSVAALTGNDKLMTAARERSITMATNQLLSHNGWDTTINSTGYTWSNIGENIAEGYTTPDTVVNGWVNSPGHYANIMTAAFKETGIGCVIDQNGTYWWTQDFGAP